MSLDPAEPNRPAMKILKMAKCSYEFGDEYVYKIFWLKEDGVWYRDLGTTHFTEHSERRAKRLGAEILEELPDDAVTDNPARDREYLRRQQQRRAITNKTRGSSHISGYVPARDDTGQWEILENHLPRLSQMQGFLRVVPTQNHFSQPPKGYCTVEVLNGSEADRNIERKD